MRTNNDDVVVFPWVPATAIDRRREQSAASMSARVRSGTPRLRARTRSMLSVGIAVDDVTTSRSVTTSASWPTFTRIPRARIRSTTSDSRMSLPVTSCPI
ncbi:MAG: hypothetical protein EB037_12315 [Actinobacteria bacterium]|nr:hypothetical protein [Actinomycetota bacterium]